MFRAGLFCLLPATFPPLHPVLYPVFCILYLSCVLHWNAHLWLFQVSTKDSCSSPGGAKGASPWHLISIPVGNISADTWFSSRHLSTPYGMWEMVCWDVGSQEEKNCANPVHQLFVLSCARVLTPMTQTLAGKSAADRSVWGPEVTRPATMIRLHWCVGSSKKPQGWDERQIGAQGQH